MLNESIDFVVVGVIVVVFENIGIQLDSKEIERDARRENDTETEIYIERECVYNCLRSNELSIYCFVR